MEYHKRSTQIPNVLFDVFLPTLSEKELKVILVVLRLTIGWVDTQGKRKLRDWISQKLFRNKTGLSGKSVSKAIDLLVNKNLIRATTKSGVVLLSSQERRGKGHIYYECTFLISKSVQKWTPPS